MNFLPSPRLLRSNQIFKAFLLAACFGVSLNTYAQNELEIELKDTSGEPISFATIGISGTAVGTSTNVNGRAMLKIKGDADIEVSIRSVGYTAIDTVLSATGFHSLRLYTSAHALDEVVVSGTLAPTLRSESPVPVEVYTRTFLLQNPEPSLFASMERVNGVRPQLNCAVCNTGDIHINGLEGPYTMVTIDGMPLVSGLATVYGLEGIPSALIERVEVVKGPAGTLYGSEAVGGLINVITRTPDRAPRISAEVFSTGLGDVNLDLGGVVRLSPKLAVLTGAQAYYYDQPRDANNDGFTDATLVERLSLFQRWSVTDGALRGLNVGGRYLTEARWGGELNFAPIYRGGNEVYGEAIDTRRFEVLLDYSSQTLPGLSFKGSYNDHRQRSDYGDTPYDADQRIAFGQVTYSKRLGLNHFLAGVTSRYTYYDDNSPATEFINDNQPEKVFLPGVFLQNEWKKGRHNLLAGLRYDHDSRHGNIFTPRLAYKMPVGEGANLRFNVGTGFRVVNLFTEDHAALSGARELVIEEEIQPERSLNGNLSFNKTWYPSTQSSLAFEASTWATRFSNQILPDYTTDATQIRYANLDGYSINHGVSGELRWQAKDNSARLGVTYADTKVFEGDTDSPTRPILSERVSATWAITKSIDGSAWALLKRKTLSFDYSGTLYGPMLLPVQGPQDLRASESPWWSLQSIQATMKLSERFQVYAGVKNLLNFRPADDAIARSFDPFDREVTFNAEGQAIATPNNPQALVFDPSYVYAPNIGRRWFAGLRLRID